MNKQIKASACLLATAIIWGLGIVIQKDGMGSIGPFLYSALRMLIGSVTLCVMLLVNDKLHGKVSVDKTSQPDKTLYIGGIVTGILMFFAANLQQIGLVYTNAGKTAFITALYILLVPIIGILLKHKTNINNWIGAVIGAVGLYFLCVTTQFTVATGDVIVFIGSFCWAAHILAVNHFAPKVDVIRLMCIQFIVSGIMSLAAAVFTEEIILTDILSCVPGLLYTGIVSTALASALQGIGQKYAHPTTASILLSTESLFATICGFIFLNEVMNGRELIGCILMLLAVILSQLPVIKIKK